jgi:hypothetical protein
MSADHALLRNPAYHPDKEPEGYMDALRLKEPETLEFDPTEFRTEANWKAVVRHQSPGDLKGYAALVWGRMSGMEQR